ncbi:hypothetical protein BU251_02715 [Candidatus Velamenicoccus archaeovorus]|uniref:Uncharacterized protein n=1 Tax=Velamenicoccus archaeovorus TaxID=1930593 RepID=A0A410P3L9_VELA1|nr:hypothetical protein BU251_02715 [Candidatus Velamenicoccus archaeovorus]
MYKVEAKRVRLPRGKAERLRRGEGCKKVRGRKALSGGFRGGNWNNDTSNARVSDRNNAANTNSNRNNNNGGRFAKTPYFLLMDLQLRRGKDEEN